MRTIRFSIAGLMGAVAMSAVGIAALRAADSTAWAGAMLMLVCGRLLWRLSAPYAAGTASERGGSDSPCSDVDI